MQCSDTKKEDTKQGEINIVEDIKLKQLQSEEQINQLQIKIETLGNNPVMARLEQLESSFKNLNDFSKLHSTQYAVLNEDIKSINNQINEKEAEFQSLAKLMISSKEKISAHSIAPMLDHTEPIISQCHLCEKKYITREEFDRFKNLMKESLDSLVESIESKSVSKIDLNKCMASFQIEFKQVYEILSGKSLYSDDSNRKYMNNTISYLEKPHTPSNRETMQFGKYKKKGTGKLTSSYSKLKDDSLEQINEIDPENMSQKEKMDKTRLLTLIKGMHSSLGKNGK